MKTHLHLVFRRGFVALLLFLSYAGMAQTKLAGWTFNTLASSPNTPTSISANFGPQTGTAWLYADGTHGSTTWTNSMLDAAVGTSLNNPDAVPIPGSAFRINPTGTLAANGKQFVLTCSMTGYENPELTFALYGDPASFSHQWAWSTDGVTFTNFGTDTENLAAGYVLRTLNMSAINQLDNAATVYLRLTVSNATAVTGRNRFDNFVIAASEQAPTFGTISQPVASCSGLPTQFDVSGLLPNSTSKLSYNINAGPTQTVTGVVSDGAGNASFNLILAPGNNGQTLTVTAVERTDHPTASVPVSMTNTVVLSVIASTTYWADNDGDGYGDINFPLPSCTGMPVGYVANDDDCDDSDPAVNPAASEILYNGIDDNCDGMMDEGFQLVTQLKPNICNTTIPAIYSTISASVPYPDMTAMRYEVTNLSTMEVQTIESTYYFQLTDLADYQYNTTYSIRVEQQRLGVWLGYYGPACTITTPSLFSGPSSIVIPECGTTLAQRFSPIFITGPNFISVYEIRVSNLTNPVGPNAVQTIIRTVPWFSLKMLNQYDYSTTYGIEVRVKTTGDYSAWTAQCNVTTPAASMTASSPVIVSAEQRAILSPNPYSETFTLTLDNSRQENLNIRVYDVLGNLRETHNIKASEMSSLELGRNFQTGVYNVVISQGDKIESVRVIKR